MRESAFQETPPVIRALPENVPTGGDFVFRYFNQIDPISTRDEGAILSKFLRVLSWKEILDHLPRSRNNCRDFKGPYEYLRYLVEQYLAITQPDNIMRFMKYAAQLGLGNSARPRRILDIGGGIGTFSFLCRNVYGCEVAITSLLDEEPYHYSVVRDRLFGLERALDFNVRNPLIPDYLNGLRESGQGSGYDFVTLHSFNGHWRHLQSGEPGGAWDPHEWYGFLMNLMKMLKPGGVIQVRFLTLTPSVFNELTGMFQRRGIEILTGGLDNHGEPYQYGKNRHQVFQLLVRKNQNLPYSFD